MKYDKGSFITVPSRALLDGLNPIAQCLFMWLCAYANETGECFPSRQTLAAKVGCSIKTIDNMLVLLIERGIVKKENRFKDNEKTTNLYSVLVVGGSVPDTPPTAPGTLPLRQEIRIELNSSLTQKDSALGSASIREVKDELTRSGGSIPKGAKQIYEPLVLWAEKERGASFLTTHRLKQYKALKMARDNKLKAADLKERWEEMASDKFWASKGFDWLNVVNSFNTKPA